MSSTVKEQPVVLGGGEVNLAYRKQEPIIEISTREEEATPSSRSYPSTPVNTLATNTASNASASTNSSLQMPVTSSRARIYRTVGEGTATKWVTREIAALSFLLGIPLEAEQSIVQAGNLKKSDGERREVKVTDDDSEGHREEDAGEEEKHELEPPTKGSRWWDNIINKPDPSKSWRKPHDEYSDLEQPNEERQSRDTNPSFSEANKLALSGSAGNLMNLGVIAPGRRLGGHDAVRIQIPVSGVPEAKTRQRSIARQAAIREWELQVAHGVAPAQEEALLDGRTFFSAKGSYPVGVFSVLRYEPKKEEAARRRQKIEARGGGGSQFVMPERDWRGTTYRALLPRIERKNKEFHRRLRPRLKTIHSSKNKESEEEEKDGVDIDDLSDSSEESDAYVPGFLDDPEMVQGRHRHVMVGDRVIGCIVSSTIQFVKPTDLKADLNKQFRERFDGWEPAKRQRKFIGAKVIDGVYTLMDPTIDPSEQNSDEDNERGRRRRGSMSSASEDAKDTIRMPPSLTLSKIRSVKRQALVAAVKAKLEVGTVALACVYFERLCLDCRVDKSNRRLSFAACLLLSAKINEANVALVMQRHDDENSGEKKSKLNPLIRPTKKSRSIFASLLEFFTHDWSINLKQLFSAEWGVFAALGFSLHATPSQVAFHFKRLMKVLEWGSLAYLGNEMYSQWQDCLEEEALCQDERKKRHTLRRELTERKLLKLERELHMKENESKRSKDRLDDDHAVVSEKDHHHHHHDDDDDDDDDVETGSANGGGGSRVGSKSTPSGKRKKPRIFKNRFGFSNKGRRFQRTRSNENFLTVQSTHDLGGSDHTSSQLTMTTKGMGKSPSMPEIALIASNDVAIDINNDDDLSESQHGIIV